MVSQFWFSGLLIFIYFFLVTLQNDSGRLSLHLFARYHFKLNITWISWLLVSNLLMLLFPWKYTFSSKTDAHTLHISFLGLLYSDELGKKCTQKESYILI